MKIAERASGPKFVTAHVRALAVRRYRGQLALTKPYEDLQRQIAIATKRQGNVLYALAREAGSDLDETAFVDRVARDLSAGRFLLLVVGDGITEGTRRIGEYLRDQPGLAFGFGLIEIAEYRYIDEAGTERVIVQPRVLAQTAVIERHVIRSEVPGLVIDTVAETAPTDAAARPPSEAGLAWRNFVERFVAETRFDDPGQPSPRSGGMGWIKLPLPLGLYGNLFRSQGEQAIGAQVRFAGSDGAVAFAELSADRDEIDSEFAANGFQLEWKEGEVPTLTLMQPSRLPWDSDQEVEQRVWMARVANQLVNSLRPRLLRIAEPVA